MSDHNTKSLGDAIKAFIATMKWEEKLSEASIGNDWEAIMGKQIAALTTGIQLKGGVLTISLKSAALRYEFQMRKQQLIDRVNGYYGSNIVKQVVLR